MIRVVAAMLILVVSSALGASSLPSAPSVTASEFGYELKITGMVCAFCAYNVSKQLRSAEGVVPDSVKVDLESGTITLRSVKPLETARLVALVEAAGFGLETVTETPLAPSGPVSHAGRAVLISLTLDADSLVEGELDVLLEALGALASRRSARVAVVAPAGLEMRVLRPILMGRQPAMDVEFSAATRPDNTVLINVNVPSDRR